MTGATLSPTSSRHRGEVWMQLFATLEAILVIAIDRQEGPVWSLRSFVQFATASNERSLTVFRILEIERTP